MKNRTQPTDEFRIDGALLTMGDMALKNAEVQVGLGNETPSVEHVLKMLNSR